MGKEREKRKRKGQGKEEGEERWKKEKGKGGKGKEKGKGKERWKEESFKKVARTDARTHEHSGDSILCPMLCTKTVSMHVHCIFDFLKCRLTK